MTKTRTKPAPTNESGTPWSHTAAIMGCAGIYRSEIEGYVDVHDKPVNSVIYALCCQLIVSMREIDELRATLAKEVRTERLVVTHPEDGRELITTELLPTSVSMRLHWLPETDERCADVVMCAGVDGEGDATGFSDVYVSTANSDAMGMISAIYDTANADRRGTTYLSLESTKWRDAATGVPFVGATGVQLDEKGLRFE